MKKLTTLAVEPYNHWRLVERSVVGVAEIEAPLARRRVLEAQRLPFNVQFLVGAVHLELLKVRVAVEKFVMVRDAVVHVPCIRVIQPVRQPPHMRLPVTDEKIEVVRAIALRQQSRIVGGLGSLRKKRSGKDCSQNNHWENCQPGIDHNSSFQVDQTT